VLSLLVVWSCILLKREYSSTTKRSRRYASWGRRLERASRWLDVSGRCSKTWQATTRTGSAIGAEFVEVSSVTNRAASYAFSVRLGLSLDRTSIALTCDGQLEFRS
jgi:hypothetical protein